MSEVPRSEEIFHAALGWPRAERAARLDDACGSDAALRARVEELLAAHDAAGDFLDRPAARPLDDVTPGTRLGRYVVGRLLGEGGVGRVFEAEQTEPVRRRVALKVIKLGMDTREVIARFEAERQALARMDHPGIAKVFDAGATPSGRPFFVMELVEGVPLTQFCDAERLAPAARIELLVRVCQAVQHAHQKGVIHRDLKPSNILVARQDGLPMPKIIDFGIAKATETPLTESTFSTAVAHFVGTPAYMSPEQTVLGGAKDIDTRSDVYSLGVLLCELLTGRTPFGSRESLRGGLDELRRRIREEEPARPSTLLTTMGGEVLALAAQTRQVEPARLVGMLRGELDWIVLRCLEKDRNRRYPTANALAEDLRRYLHHEPVNAVASSAGYIFGKFARRYRTAVAAGGFVAAVLVAATVVSLWQAGRAARAEHRAADRAAAESRARAAADAARLAAERAEKVAQDEAATSAAISEFLRKDLLAQASPNNQRNRDLKLRDALDAAAVRIDGRFPSRPVVEVAIRETLGETYQALGEFATAQVQLEKGLAGARTALGADQEDTLRIASRLVLNLRTQGKLKEAETLGADTLARLERSLGPDHLRTIELRNLLPSLLLAQGRFAEAEALLVRALDASRRVLGPEQVSTMTVMANLALTWTELGRYADAIRLGEETAALRERVLGPDNPQTLLTRANLAEAYARVGRLAEAERIAAAVYAARQRVLGPDHPSTLSIANQVAALALRLGRPAEAEAIYRRTLEGQRKRFGPEATEPNATLMALADALLEQGKFSDAVVEASAAHAGYLKAVGPTHPETGDALAVLVRAFGAAGDSAAGAGPAAQLVADVEKLGPDDPRRAAWRHAVGSYHLAAGDPDRAAAALQPAWEQRRRLAPASPDTVATAVLYVRALVLAGRAAAAEPVLREAVETVSAHPGAISPGRSQAVRREMAALYDALGRPEEAAKWR